MAIFSRLLQNGGVNSIALLEDFLRRGPLADEAGDPRFRAGILIRLAEAVEDICGCETARSDVEAALLGKTAS